MAPVSNIFGVLGFGLGIFGTLFYLVFYRKSHNRHHLVIAGFFVFFYSPSYHPICRKFTWYLWHSPARSFYLLNDWSCLYID